MRWISSCSLLLIAAACLGQSDAEWAERVKSASTADKLAIRQLLDEIHREYADAGDRALQETLAEISADLDAGTPPNLNRLQTHFELRSRLKAPATSPKETAKRILARPEFRDPEEQEGSNWIARALARLQDLFRRSDPQLDLPDANLRPPALLNLGGFFWVVVAILGVGLLVGLYLAFRNSKLRRTAKRSGARHSILDEEEPDRTLDEWLTLADQLEAQGRWREVVRCLYVAMLLRLDAARIIRFERSETNWEHLSRIELSAAPPQIAYRAMTQLFDRIWYGEQVASSSDCHAIREQYVLLTSALREAA